MCVYKNSFDAWIYGYLLFLYSILLIYIYVCGPQIENPKCSMSDFWTFYQLNDMWMVLCEWSICACYIKGKGLLLTTRLSKDAASALPLYSACWLTLLPCSFFFLMNYLYSRSDSCLCTESVGRMSTLHTYLSDGKQMMLAGFLTVSSEFGYQNVNFRIWSYSDLFVFSRFLVSVRFTDHIKSGPLYEFKAIWCQFFNLFILLFFCLGHFIIFWCVWSCAVTCE